MLFYYCDDCGFSFPKKQSKEGRCLRCGSSNLYEENIPKSELNLADLLSISKISEMKENHSQLKTKKGK